MPSSTMTPDAFRNAVIDTKTTRRCTFTAALSITLTQYQEQAHADAQMRPACANHCSLCCYQMVAVYPGEWEHILSTLKSKHRKERIRWRGVLQKIPALWKRYLREKRLDIASIVARNPRDVVRAVAADWRGKPCVFLQIDGSCGIYDARPLPCRITSSPVRCTEPAHIYDGEHVAQGRYEPEHWASHIANQWHEARGEFVAPFHHFIARDINAIKNL